VNVAAIGDALAGGFSDRVPTRGLKDPTSN